MDYKKYFNYLEDTFEKSFAFSKEVALKRDNKLIRGFIFKAEEEVSFNDFYSFGNENILKYSGVIAGLEEKHYPFFEDIPLELAWKLHEIDKVSNQLMKEYDEHKRLFDTYKLAAEFCLYIYIDEKLKFNKLDTRLAFSNILRKARKIVDANEVNSHNTSMFNLLIKEGEDIIEQIKNINKKLDSNVFLKKNAFYATKNFYWLHEKGLFDGMTNIEIKTYYSQKVKEEIKQKRLLLQGDFNADTNSNKNIVVA